MEQPRGRAWANGGGLSNIFSGYSPGFSLANLILIAHWMALTCQHEDWTLVPSVSIIFPDNGSHSAFGLTSIVNEWQK